MKLTAALVITALALLQGVSALCKFDLILISHSLPLPFFLSSSSCYFAVCSSCIMLTTLTLSPNLKQLSKLAVMVAETLPEPFSGPGAMDTAILPGLLSRPGGMEVATYPELFSRPGAMDTAILPELFSRAGAMGVATHPELFSRPGAMGAVILPELFSRAGAMEAATYPGLSSRPDSPVMAKVILTREATARAILTNVMNRGLTMHALCTFKVCLSTIYSIRPLPLHSSR
jgi:hypothetical protein